VTNAYLTIPLLFVQSQLKRGRLDDGEVIILDWVKSRSEYHIDENGLIPAGKDETPIVVIHHGAMCDSRDLPGNISIIQH
jgi:hypothetical protein